MNSIQKLFRVPSQMLTRALRIVWPEPQSKIGPSIDFDQISAEGLRLREAIAVRSAEFWLALGEPRLALHELEALTELARQNAWTSQVRKQANEFTAMRQ